MEMNEFFIIFNKFFTWWIMSLIFLVILLIGWEFLKKLEAEKEN